MTDQKHYIISPAWSPDGSWIAFTYRVGSGEREIYAVRSDATGLVNLTNNPAGDDANPAWRP